MESAPALPIRPVTSKDIPAIAILEAETFPGDPWSEALLYDASVHPDTLFLVAEQTGDNPVPAGYCVLRTVLEEGSVDNICVAPAHRRQGLARRLLQHAMTQAQKECGAKSFTLEVRASNNAARALYESMGFINEGIRPSYYERPREDAVIYRKPSA